MITAKRRGTFLEALFGRGIPLGLAAMKERAQVGLQAVVKWLLGMSVDYLLAAALAIVSLALLVGAAVDGLVAAGLPAWAASLIFAAVSGGLAFLFFRKGKKRSIEETRRHEEEDGRAAAPPRTLTVRLVREKRSAGNGDSSRAARTKGRTARPARRSRVRVTEGADRRALRRSGARR